MEQKRKVAYLTARETIEFRECPIPEPGPGEVLIRMKAVGVCGSDVAYFKTGRTGVGELRFPHVLGHECAGVVEAVGAGVDNLRPGDCVTTEPGFACGKCEPCATGRYNLCEHMSFMGSAVSHAYGEGALTEFGLRPAHLVFKLPERFSFAMGAMMEPLSVGLQAVRTSGIASGGRAAILGGGPIGLCILMMLRASGVREVTVTDVLPDRLVTAERFGARAWDASATDGNPVALGSLDAVFDTTCHAPSINASLRWLKKGATLVQVGVPGGPLSIDMQTLFNLGISIRPSFRYANTYLPLMSMMRSQEIPVEELISHRFPFEQAQEAFELAASRRPGVMKVLIEF